MEHPPIFLAAKPLLLSYNLASYPFAYITNKLWSHKCWYHQTVRVHRVEKCAIYSWIFVQSNISKCINKRSLPINVLFSLSTLKKIGNVDLLYVLYVFNLPNTSVVHSSICVVTNNNSLWIKDLDIIYWYLKVLTRCVAFEARYFSSLYYLSFSKTKKTFLCLK